MNILLVNDDGIDSPHLRALCAACAARGHRVTVCAPKTQQSAKSHAFTISTPVMVKKSSMPGALAAWAVDGTPVDCTRLGVKCLCEETPDVVISGINQGYNVGLATYVSGTVGAAREAAFMGLKSLAVSIDYGAGAEAVTPFAEYAARLAERLADYPAPRLSVCNVNAPALPREQWKGTRVCPLNRNIYEDSYERRQSPRGDVYFWLAPEYQDSCPTPGGDLDALTRGYVSVTFLGLDGDDQTAFEDFPIPF